MRLRTNGSIVRTLALLMSALTLGGCLMVERKDYSFTIKPDGSGSGKITFHNIVSVVEDSADLSFRDYTELVNDYFKGRKFEDMYPAYTNIKKRLYEQDGKLFGEITFEFESYESAGFYRHRNQGPWMYYTGSISGVSMEQLDTTSKMFNGAFGGDGMPVIFWADGTKEFRFSTTIEEPDRKAISLLPTYKRIGTE